jgi:hypothetical protein
MIKALEAAARALSIVVRLFDATKESDYELVFGAVRKAKLADLVIRTRQPIRASNSPPSSIGRQYHDRQDASPALRMNCCCASVT